jgi:hypothetical protein
MALGLSAAYAQAGYRLANTRQNWSALRADGGAVALSVWSDEIDKTSEPWRYAMWDHPTFHAWRDRPGQMTRAGHIAHGLAHCGGRFDLILCRAKAPVRDPRVVEEARHWVQRVGVIAPEDFRPDTGEFIMTLVPAAPAVETAPPGKPARKT